MTIIDSILNKDIGLVVFEKNVKIFLKTLYHKNHGLGLGYKDYIKNMTKSQVSSFYSFAEINNPIIKGLFKSSYSYFKNISDYFNLSESEIPCVIILSRNNLNNKWVINFETQNQLEAICSFFREIANIASIVPQIEKENSKLRSLPNQISELKIEVELCEEKLKFLRSDIKEYKVSIIEKTEKIRQELILRFINFDLLNQYVNTFIHAEDIKLFEENIYKSNADELRHWKKETIEKYGCNLFSTLKKEFKQLNIAISEEDILKDSLNILLKKLNELNSIDLLTISKDLIMKREILKGDINNLIIRYGLLFSINPKYRRIKELVDEIFVL